MLPLKYAIDVDDLIKVVSMKTGKPFSVVEDAFWEFYLYPESNPIRVWSDVEPDNWLLTEIQELMKQAGQSDGLLALTILPL